MDAAEAIAINEIVPLPAYEDLWESIVISNGIKDRLLRTALLSFRLRADLPFDVSALHGLIVLYGPPGNGKTTLARSLGQEIAPYTKQRHVRLIEVNPHGLMSSEHGQSQQKVSELLVDHIPALADDGLPTVVVLDEVESMAVARSEASLSANPADVHRATDAVLTALDRLATSSKNLLFVATSNFTTALDTAFLSRADAVFELPTPDAAAAASILTATLSAMAKTYPKLGSLIGQAGLIDVGKALGGADGRQIRKAVTEAMAIRLETVQDPGELQVADLLAAAKDHVRWDRSTLKGAEVGET